MEARDPYYSRNEVSNSELSWLQKYFEPEHVVIDKEKAFANGTLIDCMITEPERVNYFTRRVMNEDYQFSEEEFEAAKEMKKAFYKDSFCAQLVRQCSFQKVSVVPQFQISYCGFKFSMPARCKWDLFCEGFDISADIKSTTATTQKQCEEALRYFEYDRSRAWYMDLENRNNDILIFISKKNFKVFKVPVKRGSQLYNEGKAKYQELAFKYWYMFGDVNVAKNV